MYNLYIRDSNFRKVGEITDFTKLDLIPRFNAVGAFALDLPTDCAAVRELIKNKAGIIVKKGGKSIFSGTVTSRKRSFSSSADTMTFGGNDDMNYLVGRLAYPVPAGDFSLNDYDIRTGKAETIMKQYVDYNSGPNALSERRILSLEADRGLGSQVTGRARFHTLLELLTSIALNGGGLGFRVVQIDDSLEFQVYQPIDKTRSAIFSPLLGNLISFDLNVVAPVANQIIVGGGGEGKDRILKQKGDSTSISKYGRMESFVDQRDTSELEELNQALGEELMSKGEQNSFNFSPVDTPQLSFLKDFGLGDKVTIVLTQPNEIVTKETLSYFVSFYQSVTEETVRIRKIQEKLDVIQDVVREVKISITPEGESVSPMVGTDESHSAGIVGIFDKMRKITKRVSKLERI
jgi:hypothetical protein